MSQIIRYLTNTGPGGFVNTLTSNIGGAVPPTAGNINVLGENNITGTGVPATSTITFNITGTTIHDVQIGNASGSLTSVPNGTTGQVLLANTGSDPSWGSVPTAGFVTSVSGGNNITITGTASAPIVNVSGTTQFTLQVGNATASLSSLAIGATNTVLLGNTGANPSFGTVPNAALTNSSVTLSNGNNITITGSPLSLGGTASFNLTGTTLNSVQIGSASGALTSVAVGSSGTVLTGVTGGAPIFQAPAASSISITGNSGGALVGNAFSLVGGTTGLAFAGAGTTETLGGTLVVANGGTNATSFATTDGTIFFDGTRLVTTATGSSGQVLTSNGVGVAPTYQAVSLTGAVTSIGAGSNTTVSGTASVPIVNLVNSPSVSGSITAATGLIATAGGIAATGTSTINSTGAASTSIGTGTGTSTFGNLTGTTTINFGGGSVLSKFINWTSYTPTVIGNTTAGTTTYTMQFGQYMVLGNLLIAQFNIAYSAATGTGSLQIGAFPLTISNTANYVPSGSIAVNGPAFPAGQTYMTLYGLANNTFAFVIGSGTLSSGSFLQISNVSTTLIGTLMYRV